MRGLFIFFTFLIFTLIVLKKWASRSRLSKKNTDKLLKSSQELLLHGQWEQVIQALTPFLKICLVRPELLLIYVQALRFNLQLTEALPILCHALRLHPNHPLLLREKGKNLLAQGLTHEALPVFEACRKSLLNEEDLFDFASVLYLEGNPIESSIVLAEVAFKTKNGKIIALAADCLFQLKEYARAAALYLKASEYEWENHTLLTKWGYALLYLNRIDEAKQCFEKITATDSGNVLAIMGLGSCLESQGHYRQALDVYQKGKAWNLNHGEMLRQAGICAVHAKQYRFGEIYLREAITLGQESVKVFAYLAYALERLKHWNEAQQIYQNLVERYPDHAVGYRGLAWLYGVGHSNGINEKTGLAMARRALDLQSDPVSWELVSACEARAGNFSKAHEIQEKLSSQTEDQLIRQRRKHAMRKLKQCIPLDETLVTHAA